MYSLYAVHCVKYGTGIAPLVLTVTICYSHDCLQMENLRLKLGLCSVSGEAPTLFVLLASAVEVDHGVSEKC